MKYKDKLSAAREYRKSPTRAESLLWQALRRKQLLKGKFRRQHVIDGFILDFYCHSLKVGIEVDGPIHRTKEGREYDTERDRIISKHNIKMMHIESEAIELALPAVLRAIEYALKNLPSPTLLERVDAAGGRVRS